jgi:RNA polymerase sigma-70 factor (ECF subfamily)
MGHIVDDSDLVCQACAGNADALGELLDVCRPRLKRMLQVRADPRVASRFDSSDVIQETCIEVTHRLQEYVADAKVPFFVWLRFLTLQKLAAFHRRHLAAQKRTAARDVALPGFNSPQASSEYLAMQLLGEATSPSQALIREEMKGQLMTVLDEMNPIDREILCLRHFEQLTNIEAAAVLELNPSAASSRYVRALAHLKEALSHLPGFLDEI